MSISSLWKAPLSMTARGALVAGSRASRDKLWSITRASTIASVSGIEKAPCSYKYLLNITNGNHRISTADLVQTEVLGHGLVPVEAGVQQPVDLRQLLRSRYLE